MNEQERELDFMIGELEQENRLMRARNSRLDAEIAVLTEMVRVLSHKLAEQEPVAWLDEYGNAFPLAAKQYSVVGKHWKPLYATPQQRTWVGLTWNDVPDEWVGKVAFMEGAKWADKQLKEKNT
jgi:hypothetical protein